VSFAGVAGRRRLGSLAGIGALTLLLALGIQCTRGKPTEGPPNILLVIVDDMGLEVGAYGDDHATSPTLDALAREGLRFDRAFVVSSTCSPSRAAILTGIPPHENGHWGFPRYTRLHRHVRTLPQYLSRAGYYTGMIGKFMVKGEEDQLAFDEFHLPDPEKSRSPDRLGRLTAKFLGQAGERPFFLMVSTHAPHYQEGAAWGAGWPTPHDPAQVSISATTLDTPPVRRKVARMYDAYSEADAAVAAVLASLDEAGSGRSTLVWFLSDHGPSLPGAKATLFDPGIRIPMIVRWPGAVEPGRTTRALVSGVDILPTLVAAAGIAVDPAVRGHSLLELMRGDAVSVRDAVYAESGFIQGNRYFPQRAIRTDRYKYIRNLRPDLEFWNNSLETWGLPMMVAWDEDPHARFLLERIVRHPQEELYDLEVDPEELHNVASDPEYATALAALRRRLRDHMDRTQDPWLPLWNHTGDSPDPFEPAATKDGPLKAVWLDEKLRDPNLLKLYRQRFP
jgi:N-sulfoglucosamine sulfohydrolase